jgi:tRNA nucleotidyltransferase (CCA-adding enzyme)
LLETTDAFRRPERFAELLLACEADARGRTGLEEQPYPQAAYLKRARDEAAAVTLTEEDRAGLQGAAIGEKLREKRLALLTAVKASC